MYGTRTAAKILLVIDIILSIPIIGLGIYYIIEGANLAGYYGSGLIIFLGIVLMLLGILSICLCTSALMNIENGTERVGLGVALILLSAFFPAGILYICCASVKPRYSYRTRSSPACIPTSSYSSGSRSITSKAKPVSPYIQSSEAIKKIYNLYKIGIIDEKKFVEVSKKYFDTLM